ncbi:MAG: DUF92 domain-containing protein [Gemmatimonadetes bacterium]|nr:DUF92 domain-containing protein [Gemmatimonadota bacterium]
MTEARLLASLALASLAGVATWRLRLLSIVGSTVAALLGAAAVLAGNRWAVLLLAFFVPAIALSRWRRQAKVRLAGGVLSPDAVRTAVQVVANGGVFAAAALATLAVTSGWPEIIGIAALTAAAADTWATEIGIGSGATPWSWRSRGPVPPGTSGAVTLPGTLAMCAGAAWMGTVAACAGFDPAAAFSGAMGGVGGALCDTLLGATVQHRRWCPRCARLTERVMHDCHTPTVGHSGWRVMDNDMVNLLSTVVGAAIAVPLHAIIQ